MFLERQCQVSQMDSKKYEHPHPIPVGAFSSRLFRSRIDVSIIQVPGSHHICQLAALILLCIWSPNDHEFAQSLQGCAVFFNPRLLDTWHVFQVSAVTSHVVVSAQASVCMCPVSPTYFILLFCFSAVVSEPRQGSRSRLLPLGFGARFPGASPGAAGTASLPVCAHLCLSLPAPSGTALTLN